MIYLPALIRAFNESTSVTSAATATPGQSLHPQPRAADLAGRTRRKRLSTTERIALLDREKHTCHICKGEIQPGQAWDVSHEIPLALGGGDDEENRRAAHRKCHRGHTATVDLPAIARAKRVRAKHHGAAVSQFPMRGGRRDALKKRMDGRVVVRATGKPWQPRRANR